jgi:hypothetical protein
MPQAGYAANERRADDAAAAFDRDAPIDVGRESAGDLGQGTRAAAEHILGEPLPQVRLRSAPTPGPEWWSGAAAYTIGSDVFLGKTSESPSDNRRLLAHELAHVVQQRHEGVGVQAAPATPPTAGGFPTIAAVLTPDGEAFRAEYADLQQRYERYKQGRPNPAKPARWVKLARDSNRAALLVVLGPNLGDEVEPENADEVDVLRLADLQRPAGYTDAQMRRDLELLQKYPGALDARLTGIPQDQLQRGEFAGGYVRIASGNVGEALAEPVLQQRLAELRLRHPDAQIFRNVRVRIPVGTNTDGSVKLSQPLLFSDGIIGRFTGSGFAGFGQQLQVLYLQEVKSGGQGGQEASEQVFRWIEHNIEDGARLVLEDGREFEYDPAVPGGVSGLMSAPRGIVAGRGVSQLGAGGSMGIAAPVERLELARSPAEMRYLAALLLQSIWAREQLRRLQQNQRTAYELKSPADLTNPAVVRKILDEHAGLAIVSGRLLQVRTSGGELSISQRPVVSLAFVYPPGTPLPAQTPVLPAGPPAPRQLGAGQPTPAPPPPAVLPPAPTLPMLPTGAAAPPLALPMLSSVSAIREGAVPATALGMWMPRVGSLGNAEWIIWDGAIRDAEGRPVTGYQDGNIWVRVIRPSGTPLPPVDPATGSPAPSGQVLTPEGPVRLQATPYDAPTPKPPSAGMRATAGAVGIIMVINEILGPIAAIRDVQLRHNLKRQGQIAFLTQFGADLKWGVEDMDKGLGMATLPWQAEQGIGAVLGDWRAARITAMDVPAFVNQLPRQMPDFQSLVLFLSSARALDLVEQDGAHYYLQIPGISYTEITATIEQIRAERLRAIDAAARTDVLARGHIGLHRVKPGATIHRYGDRVRAPWTLTSFNSPVLTAPEMMGANAWVREVGADAAYPSRSGRLHVEAANAEAAAVAQNALYIVHKSIGDVYDEVKGQGRAITSRQPSEGSVEAFSAGAFPPELGPTLYVRHPYPDAARMYTVASGELLQFWVDRDDVETVTEEEAAAYAHGTPTAPPPSRLFTTEKRQELPLI